MCTWWASVRYLNLRCWWAHHEGCCCCFLPGLSLIAIIWVEVQIVSRASRASNKEHNNINGRISFSGLEVNSFFSLFPKLTNTRKTVLKHSPSFSQNFSVVFLFSQATDNSRIPQVGGKQVNSGANERWACKRRPLKATARRVEDKMMLFNWYAHRYQLLMASHEDDHDQMGSIEMAVWQFCKNLHIDPSWCL